ncbi:Uncharacterized protein APZ42_028434 [Daphnia magna]|uniref:Uncharacterized protein n=1 Tax=Daphnia magna TaxID=35525 RepID=A0A164QI84_9CRUS|nr:Uncharacterized protein APZ42_028434 [Daphnia magna]
MEDSRKQDHGLEMEISVQPSPIIFRVKCIDGFLLDINTNSPILRCSVSCSISRGVGPEDGSSKLTSPFLKFHNQFRVLGHGFFE